MGGCNSRGATGWRVARTLERLIATPSASQEGAPADQPCAAPSRRKSGSTVGRTRGLPRHSPDGRKGQGIAGLHSHDGVDVRPHRAGSETRFSRSAAASSTRGRERRSGRSSHDADGFAVRRHADLQRPEWNPAVRLVLLSVADRAQQARRRQALRANGRRPRRGRQLCEGVNFGPTIAPTS